MIIGSALQTKRSWFAKPWLAWLSLSLIALVGLALFSGRMEDERARLSPQESLALGQMIRSQGLDCPMATQSSSQPEDAFGQVTRVRCSNGVEFRITKLSVSGDYLVQPWP